MADFTIKAHDTLPSIQATLSIVGIAGGASLEGTNVKFVMRLKGSTGAPKVARAATIVDPVNGQVRYDWQPADTTEPGEYQAEWEVTYANGAKRTFPTATYHSIAVVADLDGI